MLESIPSAEKNNLVLGVPQGRVYTETLENQFYLVNIGMGVALTVTQDCFKQKGQDEKSYVCEPGHNLHR